MGIKKYIKLLILGAIVFLLLGTTSVAAQTPDGQFTLNASGNIITKGSSGVIVLNVSSTTPVNAVQATVSYPPNKLTLVKVDTTTSAFEITAKDSATPGIINIARGTLKPVAGENKVATITFTAKETTPVSEITLITPSLIASSTTHENIFQGVTYHTVQGNTTNQQVTKVDVPTQYLDVTPTPKRNIPSITSLKKSFIDRVIVFLSLLFKSHK